MKKIAVVIAAVLLSGCGLPTTTVTAPAPPPSTVQVTTTAPAPSVPVETPEAPSQGWDGQTTEAQDDQVVDIVSGLFEKTYGQAIPADMRSGVLKHAKNYCTARSGGLSSDQIFQITEKEVEKLDLSASQKKIVATVIGWSYGAGYQVYCPEFPKDF
mgnify:CR=1 FL=1